MDATDENHMEIKNKQMMDKDFAAGLSDVTHQRLTISEGPSISDREVRVRFRLQGTKSFPPYSHCIGGLGAKSDSEPNSEASVLQHFRHDEMMRDKTTGISLGTESKENIELTTRCARDEIRAKWKVKRRERLGGSYEADIDRWGKWSGKRRVGETGGEREHDDKERDGSKKSECQYWRTSKSCFEKETKEDGDEERERPPTSEVEGELEDSRATHEGDDEEAEELPQIRGGSATHQWSSPHPIFSKLLHSSSSNSSCSSINISSSESDEVFSEGEAAGTKKKTLRKSHSWKTYLTMMHWSLRRQSSWVQLAGHQGNFQLSDGGEVLKLYSEVEAKCLDYLMRDLLRPFVPQYHGLITRGECCYIRLEDLLSGLRRPVIMDCKMGVRTYQEEELVKARTKATLRTDMYQKMVNIDVSAPSAEEHAQKGVTKWRYLQWRDTTTSTSTLGFRIEGIMMEDGSIQRDFQKILTLAQVTEVMLFFTRSELDILKAYHSRLLALSDALTHSHFFRTHEVIGSSLLFVHDHSNKASVWMIDFGKTTPVPDASMLRHNIPWAEGSREDGYLIGLTSLITSLSQAISLVSWHHDDSGGEEKSVT